MGWQWHQLDHMQIICILLQRDNHASTWSLNFLQAVCSSWRPNNSVKALKANYAMKYSVTKRQHSRPNPMKPYQICQSVACVASPWTHCHMGTGNCQTRTMHNSQLPVTTRKYFPSCIHCSEDHRMFAENQQYKYWHFAVAPTDGAESSVMYHWACSRSFWRWTFRVSQLHWFWENL